MTPADLALPMPLAVAKLALVAAFVLHIVFVNLMVGGTAIALHAHWLGVHLPPMRRFAAELISTVTVHKSVAVVLGVGPLLLISIAYTGPFYTSSALIAPAWLAVLPMVTAAFLLLYAYKYGFDGWGLARPRAHAATGAAAMAILLAIPLIYLTNTQLMLDAAAMARQPGFFEAMVSVGNVFPRYLHFMLASLAVTGLFIALWWRDEEIVALGTRWALGATSAQFMAGPIVLFTLPRGGLTVWVALALAIGVLAGLGAIFMMADTLRGTNRMRQAAVLIAVTVVSMGGARHLIRESLLGRDTGQAAVGAPGGPLLESRQGIPNRERGDHEHPSRDADDQAPAPRGGVLPGP